MRTLTAFLHIINKYTYNAYSTLQANNIGAGVIIMFISCTYICINERTHSFMKDYFSLYIYSNIILTFMDLYDSVAWKERILHVYTTQQYLILTLIRHESKWRCPNNKNVHVSIHIEKQNRNRN